MAREPFPPISRPVPVRIQESDYRDSPLELKPNHSSISENGSDLRWFRNLCSAILPAKWTNVLFTTKDKHDSRTVKASGFTTTSNSKTYGISKPAALFSTSRRSKSGGISTNYTTLREAADVATGEALKQISEDATFRHSTSKTLPDLPRLSWTDWRSEDLLRAMRSSLDGHGELGAEEAASSTIEDLLRAFITEALFQADDLDQVDIWLRTTDFVFDRQLLWMAVDRIIYKENPPAWETLGYFIQDDSTIEKYRAMYSVAKQDIRMLGSFLTLCEDEDSPTIFALWRIWSYCIISIESFVSCDCIEIQAAWLRGPTSDRLQLGSSLNFDELQVGKLSPADGIFAQGNKDLSVNDIDHMIRIWDLLQQRWSETMNAKTPRSLQDMFIMTLFARATGPKDILNILQRPQNTSFGFEDAFRVTQITRNNVFDPSLAWRQFSPQRGDARST